MFVVAQTSVELFVAIAALITSLGGGLLAFFRLPTERQVSIVGAQDTVIDNLREEIERQRIERKIEIEEIETRYRRKIARLESQLAAEAKVIDGLKCRIEELERKESA